MEEKNLLADIPREGEEIEKALDSVDKELQVEKAEDKTEVEKPAESQPEKLELPDEAVLKKNSAWEEMRVAREEAEEKARIAEEKLQALERERLKDSDFVQSLVGDNDDVKQKWELEKKSLIEEAKRELAQDQLNAQKKEQEQKEYWTNWTSERLAEVEKEFSVDFKTNESMKNELSKVMLDYSPTDEAGNLDYRKGMKILQDLNKVKGVEEAQKTQVKKNIADATVSKETSVKENKGFVTSNDIRGKDWRSILN